MQPMILTINTIPERGALPRVPAAGPPRAADAGPGATAAAIVDSYSSVCLSLSLSLCLCMYRYVLYESEC